jgi:hypothetical protein
MHGHGVDGRGVLWALFFGLIVLALFDILSGDSVVVDYFTGGSATPEDRLERAVGRALNGRSR